MILHFAKFQSESFLFFDLRDAGKLFQVLVVQLKIYGAVCIAYYSRF